MAADTKSDAGQVISEVSKQEGGTFKGTFSSPPSPFESYQSYLKVGSTAAQMQSQTTKQRNLEDAAAQVGSKLDAAPETVTTEDASLLHSREARVMGGPTKGDLASQAQSVAAANEQGATVQSNLAQSNGTNADLTPAEQSQLDREANYVEAADTVGTKMAMDPESVTKEDGDLVHSRETRAFGVTEKGGIASQAQSQAAKNAGDNA